MPETTPYKILHADDREENRYIISKILRTAGYEVISVGTGRDAMEKAMEQPDLIILDVRLPDMIGYEVSARLKSNHLTSSIPIIQLSASFVTNESKVQALDSGADQYLTQPVEPPVLVASIKALLRMRKAEAISRLSARQWQTTFDALSEGIGLLDLDQRVLRCNRAMSELLGMPYGKIEGQDCKSILSSVFGASGENLRDFFSRQVFESQAGIRWFRITVDPVFNDGPKPVGSIIVIADITAQKQAEEALKVTEKLAATGRLAHSIAHEINNPLEAVTNLIYLLKGSLKDEEKATGYLDIAETELQRVSRITKQTLSFHRDSSKPVLLAPSDVIGSALALYRRQLGDCGISVEERFEAHALIEAFPGQLRQVFSNFIANAIDATPRGGKLIIHTYDSHAWDHHRTPGVRVNFFDTGKGIAKSDVANIFKAFFTTKEQKGSGLGLWLSAGILNQHRARVTVRSRTLEPSGTCFSLFFPSAGAAHIGEEDEKAAASAAADLRQESA
jgi:two-component system, NtrC family, sensor kinase